MAVRAVGDVTDPLRVFEHFLDLASEGRLDSDEGRTLLAPGFDGALNAGERVRCDMIVRVDSSHAVARVSLREPEQTIETGEGDQKSSWKIPAHTLDTYWYLEEQDGWRVYTMRALAQTGLLERMAWMVEDPAVLGAEHAALAENARLTLKSDLELVRWFREHAPEITELASGMRARATAGESSMVRAAKADDPGSSSTAPSQVMKRLAVLYAEVGDHGDFELVVGGITDNVVSFRHIASGAAPRISDDDVIWAEDLGGGWFLVKTT